MCVCVWHFSSLKTQWRSSATNWKSKPSNALRTRSNSLAFSRARTQSVSSRSTPACQSKGQIPNQVGQIIHKEEGPSAGPVLGSRETSSAMGHLSQLCKTGRGTERTLRLDHVLWRGVAECFPEERKALPPLFYLPIHQLDSPLKRGNWWAVSLTSELPWSRAGEVLSHVDSRSGKLG